MTSRELVYATLEFRNNTGAAPRNLWTLGWAADHYPDELRKINEDFPDDFVQGPYTEYAQTCRTAGSPHEIGDWTDEWGCRWTRLERGLAGEVKNPIVPPEDEDWEDVSAVHIPEEFLSFDACMVDKSCRETDKFVIAGACPNPFERLQYIRGTEQLYIDLITKPKGMLRFIERLHDFYMRLLEKW
ncbi:MAG: methyltransferase, partial [Defluviitaleaceae bacterium]|nr:methyltransferase [Defluviitaleaceae bacterium]